MAESDPVAFARENLAVGGELSAAKARTCCALLDAALDVDLEARLATNAIPTDLVWGEDDRVFGARTRDRYARTLAKSELHLLAGASHMTPLDAPADLARIVRSRLRALSRG
jgi:pimeloyl-ACP methyl ester carboxylesterase